LVLLNVKKEIPHELLIFKVMFEKVRDLINLINKVSIFKFFNLVKLGLSFSYSVVLRKARRWGQPYAIAFEPTTICNLECPECPSGLRKFTRPTGNANLELFEKTISQTKKHAFYLTLYFQGEPLINPDFFKMVKSAKQNNFYVTSSSNAHYFNKENAKKTVESGLDRLIISVDGITQESYSKYRVGGKLNTVLEGIENLVNAKKELNSSKPFIIVQFLAFSHNKHEIGEIKNMKTKYGVNDVKIKLAQFYNPNTSELIPKEESLTRYKKNNSGDYIIKNNQANRCWRLWSSPVITQDGQVLPCCFDKDANYPMGKLENESFSEIWNNKKYNGFRKQLFSERNKIDICQNCSEGSKVWF